MPILNWIGKLFIEYIVKKLIGFFAWVTENEKKKAINRDNLKRYEEAVKGGNEDEIAKAGEDLLNGISRTKS